MAYKLSDKKLELYNDRQKMIDINCFPKDLTIISNTCIPTFNVVDKLNFPPTYFKSCFKDGPSNSIINIV